MSSQHTDKVDIKVVSTFRNGKHVSNTFNYGEQLVTSAGLVITICTVVFVKYCYMRFSYTVHGEFSFF